MFFDRDKVKMCIVVEQTTLIPGQHIVGCLRVDVLKSVDLTAIRLRVRGKENTSFQVKQKGRGNQTCEESHIHYEHLITFFGYSKESGRTGGATLDPGSYTYPFDLQLPPNAPPSYHCCIAAGTSKISYTLKAMLDIPRGLDGKTEVPLLVLPPITQQQYEHLSHTTKTVPNNSVGIYIDPGCCSMNRDPGAMVEVAAELPTILLVRPIRDERNPLQQSPNSRRGGGDDGPAMLVRLTLRNGCRKKRLRSVRVSLLQQQRLMAQGEAVDAVQSVATVVTAPPSGQLIPRATVTFDVRLPLPSTLRLTSDMQRSCPLPTMATPCLEVSNFLTVSFPDCDVDAMMTVRDVAPLVAAVDVQNCVPAVPCGYTQVTVVPEAKLGAE